MAHYDTPGLHYGQAHYDEPDAPPPKPKHMARIKLSLKLLTVEEKVALAELLVTKMTGNPDFTDPEPTLASITALKGELHTLAGTQKAAQSEAKEQTALLNTKEDELDTALTSLGGWAEGHVLGSGDKLVGGGFSLQADGSPTQVVQLTSLAVSRGDNAGEVDWMADAQEDATGYEIQCSTNPNDPSLWRHVDVFSSSSGTVTGLTTGTRCWIRGRARGTSDKKGPWSSAADVVVG